MHIIQDFLVIGLGKKKNKKIAIVLKILFRLASIYLPKVLKRHNINTPLGWSNIMIMQQTWAST